MLNHTDPLLDLQEQMGNTRLALDYIRTKLTDKEVSLVWCRYFLSDPVNQYDYLDLPEGAAVSIVGQAPLNYTKLSVWLYFTEGAGVIAGEDLTVVRRPEYEHYFHSRLSCTSDDREYEQTREIFSTLNSSLRKQGMTPGDHLIRTWIYVQGVDTHYQGMVRARRELFTEENLTEETHYIASTGIEGRFLYPSSLVFMDAYSLKGVKQEQISYLKALDYLSPTNRYGVTFERGTRVQYGDRSHIFISGTASIDRDGEIVAPHDIISQTHRTLKNIEALLKEAGAGFSDLAHLIVYLRDTADYPLVRRLVDTLLPDLPKVYLLAAVCRPGWLIEMECMAISPQGKSSFPAF